MEVILKLGSKLKVSQSIKSTPSLLTRVWQESEVLERRLDTTSSAMNATLEVMDTKDGMMRWLETGTKNLGLLVSLGKSASEVCSPVDTRSTPY